MDYYNFNGLMNENTYTSYNILDDPPFLFILYDLQSIINSDFLCYLQDSASFIDLFLGPGIYYYNIRNNFIECINNIMFFPFYNDRKYIKKKEKA